MKNLVLLLSLMFLSFLAKNVQTASTKEKDNVREACSVTRYKNICMHSLASFSNTTGRSPSKWARTGVSVTISEVKNVQAYLAKLKRYKNLRGENRIALSDCVETFSDAIDELHRSLGVLGRLSKRTFGAQMEDINTWISAALTDENTCLDGFEGLKDNQIKLLRDRVLKVSYITSNALALVNELATAGLESISSNRK